MAEVHATCRGTGPVLAAVIDEAKNSIREFFSGVNPGAIITWEYGDARPMSYELSGKPTVWEMEVTGIIEADG